MTTRPESIGDILAAVDITLEHIAQIRAAALDCDTWFAAWAEAQLQSQEGLLRLFLSEMRADRFYDAQTLALVQSKIAAGLGERPN